MQSGESTADEDGSAGDDGSGGSSSGAGIRFVRLGALHAVFAVSDPRRRIVAKTRPALDLACKKLQQLTFEKRLLDEADFGPYASAEILIARMGEGIEIWFDPEEDTFTIYRGSRPFQKGLGTLLAARRKVAEILASGDDQPIPTPAGPGLPMRR